jgi:RyR domain
MQDYTREQICRVVHEAVRALQYAQADPCPAPPWDAAPADMRLSMISTVNLILDHDILDPAAIHEAWMVRMLDRGWKYGPVKDDQELTHPCMLAWPVLPAAQRDKDVLCVRLTRVMTDQV